MKNETTNMKRLVWILSGFLFVGMLMASGCNQPQPAANAVQIISDPKVKFLGETPEFLRLRALPESATAEDGCHRVRVLLKNLGSDKELRYRFSYKNDAGQTISRRRIWRGIFVDKNVDFELVGVSYLPGIKDWELEIDKW